MKKHFFDFLPIVIFGTLVTILLTFPLILRLSTLYSDSGDYSLIGWMLWHSSNAITSGEIFNQVKYFNANQFYPFPYSLAYSENLFFPALLFTPVYLLSNNLSLSVNLYAFLTLVLSFISCFYVFNYLIKNRYAAVAGAVIYTFNPVAFAHFPGHLHLASKFFLPLVFLFVYKFLIRPNWKDAVLLGLTSTLNALTGIHFGIFAITFVPLFSIPFLIYPFYKMHTGYFIRLTKYSLIVLLFIPVVLYIYGPYLEFSKKEGIIRGIFESASYSAQPIDYISNLPNNLIYGSFVRSIESFRAPNNVLNYAEHSLALNVIPLVLFFLGLYSLKKTTLTHNKKLLLWGLLIVGVASVILSFGPVFRGWILPYYYLNTWFHLFDGIRVPSRFQIIFYIPFAYMCALGITFVYHKFTKRFVVIFAVILFLIFLENINIQEYRERSNHIPVPRNQQADYSQFKFLKNKQTMHLPTFYWNPWLQNEYLNLSTISGEKTLNGYSGYFPKDWTDMLAEFERKFDERALKKLKAMGIQYVIIHKMHLDRNFADRNLAEEFIGGYRYFENDYYLILTLENIDIALCSLNKDIDFLLNPYQKSYGEKTTFFYRLTIKNNSDCYLPSLLQDRYLEREFYFNGHRYTQNIKMPLVMEPYEQVIKK